MSVSAALLLAAGLTACTGGAAPGQPTPSTASSVADDPDDDARIALAARAALAQDHRFAALYHFAADGGPVRNVVATVAGDGSWRVDVAGGALGGTTDVSIVSNPDGVFQCSLPSATNPVPAACVEVAAPGKPVPKASDPKVERLFRQWLSVFTDRQAALSVSTAGALPGAQGKCYSVDTISASLAAPVDIGIYCYADDGLLTAAKVEFGELTLASTPVTPPAKVDLPGPISAGSPMGMASPSPSPPPDVPPSSVVSGPPPA
jgi:hypothetical protein